jgi:hypothetical protein
MATRRTRSSSQSDITPDPETENVDFQQIESTEQTEVIEEEPKLSDDLIVFQAVEKAKKLEETKKSEPKGDGIVSDRQINMLRKFNERIVNKLGLNGTRSYKV